MPLRERRQSKMGPHLISARPHDATGEQRSPMLGHTAVAKCKRVYIADVDDDTRHFRGHTRYHDTRTAFSSCQPARRSADMGAVLQGLYQPAWHAAWLELADAEADVKFDDGLNWSPTTMSPPAAILVAVSRCFDDAFHRSPLSSRIIQRQLNMHAGHEILLHYFTTSISDKPCRY